MGEGLVSFPLLPPLSIHRYTGLDVEVRHKYHSLSTTRSYIDSQPSGKNFKRALFVNEGRGRMMMRRRLYSTQKR